MSVVLQILGTSDVQVDGKPGQGQIEGFDLAEMRDAAEMLRQELLADLGRVDFPLIRTASRHLAASPEFVVLLTDQTAWFQAQQTPGDGWKEIISSDGHWWQEILQAWGQKHGIRCHCVRFQVPPGVSSGVADWEAMAEQVTDFLGQLIKHNEVHLPDGRVLPYESLFIQHSSGTPALSGALYLWGIEQRLANKNVEFLYLSRQDEQVRQHDGSHWQWRLKVPQIQQLLSVQDFAGILQLVKGDVPPAVEKQVRRLDRAVSFNLRELNLGLTPENEVLERIAIACWSEKGFRERGQWMHWILRVAGAFELVLKYLVARQGEGNFSWQREQDGFVNLYYHQGSEIQPVIASITAIARGLQQGCFVGKRNYEEFTYTFQPIPAQPKLLQFQQFYCDAPGWVLNQNHKVKFANIRNDLYHSLQGDVIDQVLDQKTQQLGAVTHQEHPAQVAVGHLRFLIELAGIQQHIHERVAHYQGLVQAIREQL